MTGAGHSRSRIAFVLFALIALYCVARAIIYYLMPIESFEQWVVRDAFMDFPRAIFLALTLAVSLRNWTLAELGVQRSGLARALVFGTLLTAIELVYGKFRNSYGLLPIRILCLLGPSSMLVGFFEEFLFRGAVLHVFRELKGARFAALASTLLFTVFHIQAQPLKNWPPIFLIGLLFAILRLQGVSLIWLALIHGSYDMLVFFGGWGEPNPSWMYFVDLGAIAALVGASSYSKLTRW